MADDDDNHDDDDADDDEMPLCAPSWDERQRDFMGHIRGTIRNKHDLVSCLIESTIFERFLNREPHFICDIGKKPSNGAVFVSLK